MDITEFTTYDEVRAVLGVPAKELPDSVLSLPLYAKTLRANLTAFGSNILTDYATAKASYTTATEVNFCDAFELFSLYDVAWSVCDALPSLSPRTITDGKAMVQRQLDSYKAVLSAVQARRATYSDALKETYSVVGGSTTSSYTPSLFSIGSPDFDPVTG
jgi:hypothetical protein